MEKDNPRKLPTAKETKIVQLLLRCGLFLEREMNQVCQQFGLKQQQFSVLNAVIWHGPISQKELCETLLFEKSNVSKIIRLLFERDLIQVTLDPHDRRMTLLSETHEGVLLWKECLRAFEKTSKTFTDDLSGEEADDAIRTLNRLIRAFKKTG